MAKVKRLRDHQVSKVYKMDREIARHLNIALHRQQDDIADINELRKFTLAFFREYKLGRPVIIKDGRGCRVARGCDRYIVMPRWARNRVVLAHELAHALVWRLPGGSKEPAHGKKFCAAYMALLEKLTGLPPDQFITLAMRCDVRFDFGTLTPSVGLTISRAGEPATDEDDDQRFYVST